jgi:transcriptional regulator with XRE-family HTH domain
VGSRDQDRERVRSFGRHVRDLRERAGLSQEELADRAGLHRSEVGFLERGEREFGVSVVWRIANGLGVRPGELVEGTPAIGKSAGH